MGILQRKKIDDYENIYSVNPLHLIIANAIGYIEEKGVNKYLFFDSTDENKELLKKYSDVWNGIKNKIKEVNDSEYDYEKDYMKIKFNSDDNLPLNKPLKFHNMTITIRQSLSEEEKNKKREYGKNRYHMSEEKKKQKLKEYQKNYN